jgi:hypothetical protein
MFNSSKQVSSLRKLLTSYSSCNSRQTVFASASIPQHNRFLYDCIQQKWTKVVLSLTDICPLLYKIFLFMHVFALTWFLLVKLFAHEKKEGCVHWNLINDTTDIHCVSVLAERCSSCPCKSN